MNQNKPVQSGAPEPCYEAKLLGSTRLALLSTDPELVIRTWNSGAEAMFGWRADEVISRFLLDIFHPDFRGIGATHVLEELKHIGWWEGEATYYKKVGLPMEVLVSASVLKAKNEITGFVIGCIDITKRLERETEHMRSLSKKILEVQENERRNISREIHDEISQSLAMAKILLDRGLSGTSLQELRHSIGQTIPIIKNMINQVRDVSLNLKPQILDDLGLTAALNSLSTNFTTKTSIPVEINFSGKEDHLASAVRLAIFRIIQESLSNVARHSRAKKVEVKFESNHVLRISILDNGIGFDPTRIPSASTGLTGMRERVFALGGQIDVTSSPGAGTRITIELPVIGEAP